MDAISQDKMASTLCGDTQMESILEEEVVPELW
jgi:hypothetical protein